MSLEVRELEAFLAVADELHFGRAAERLYLSQSRISQLLRALEQRIGARLIERTSRRVRLTPLGADFRVQLEPAYAALRASVDDARAAARGVTGLLRIGFQGAPNDQVMAAIELFGARHPDCAITLTEIPLADPFGPVYRDEVDAAIVLLPIEEPDLVLGQVFSQHPFSIAVAAGHPFATRTAVTVEELADCSLITVRGPALDYWRRVQAPHLTPSGHPIPSDPAVATLEEGLALVSVGRGAMLLCHATGESHTRRSVTFVPVLGLPDSRLGLIWHRTAETARLRAFSQALAVAGDRGPISA
ncbi:LysR family transcriptional regulator [Nocardia crassostreae]|uniref:LysR family transcriptional regulator n=1 Tax=Nocardia crassostreae TaxID=53428 RepID=UPI00082C05E5|nr:LysR family transcriptional regulator [Nocardia crassostreae]